MLRKQLRNLKKQMKAPPEGEAGLQELLKDMTFSLKQSRTCQEKTKLEGKPRDFVQSLISDARQLFQQQDLDLAQKEFETHLCMT
ncbi:hypothetical protein PoB_006488300 [Plakobranchus ocellatus]|uniref:Uncharacterized protein n=1 Tax=Plakobranchus ocellatus TaxID=259542 RepID=A0AAV4D2W3_9GAST|nr:hypothetical protein PoB_006488300 [Plakobranchus ocellatus]